jgi:hypothetical protein
MLFTGMMFTEAIEVFFRKMESQTRQPVIIPRRLASPYGTRMKYMTRTISDLS